MKTWNPKPFHSLSMGFFCDPAPSYQFQYTIHWKPITTQQWMDEPKFIHNWVINVPSYFGNLCCWKAFYFLFPLPSKTCYIIGWVLRASPSTQCTTCFGWTSQSTRWLWLSIWARYAEVGKSHNTVVYHSILAQYAEVGKSHNTVVYHSILAQYAEVGKRHNTVVYHSIFAQSEEVGKRHNTVLTFALDWSDILIGS
jgi:hypothetical protein